MIEGLGRARGVAWRSGGLPGEWRWGVSPLMARLAEIGLGVTTCFIAICSGGPAGVI
jgi:hypothetical protein